MSNRIPQNTGLPVGYSSGSSLPASQVPPQVQEIEEISLSIFKQPQPVGVRKDVVGTTLKTYQLPSKDSVFIERKDLLKEVEKRAQEGQVVALSGMGGIGKSSLALRYAYEHQSEYQFVWWLSGEDPLRSYRELGETLKIVRREDTPEEVIKKLHNWMTCKGRCLLIFDNAENPNELKRYFPPAEKTILITSRNPHSQWDLPVPLLSSGDALELLQKITGHSELLSGDTLAKELGYLPLALMQAGAYMKQTNTSFAKYLLMFYKERPALWKEEKAPGNYPYTVATTFKISMDKIQQETPDALELLSLAAYVAPDHIPKSLFASGGQPKLLLNSLLQSLSEFSLLKSLSNESYSIHRLIQLVVRDQQSPDAEKASLRTLLNRLKKEWQFSIDDPTTWENAKMLFPHVAAFCSVVAKEKGNFAWLVDGLGDWTASKSEGLPIAFHCTYRLSEMGDLIYLLNGLGEYSSSLEIDLERSIGYYTQGLEISKKAFGEEYPSTAAFMNNLGNVYQAQKKYPEAIDWHTQSLEVYKKIQPLDRQIIGVAFNNLGADYYAQGDLAQAMKFYEESLKIKRALKEETASFAITLNNLGLICMAQKDFPKAVELHEESLAIRRHLGEEGPDLTDSLLNLGNAYREMGKPQQALTYLEEGRAILEKLYSKGHTRIAVAQNNLGLAYDDAGDFVKAITCHNKALDIYKNVSGEESPDVGTSFFHLYHVYDRQKNWVLAAQCLTKSLKIRIKTYGTTDKGREDLSKMYNQLGAAYYQQEKFAKATRCLLKALEIGEGVFEKEPGSDLDTVYTNLYFSVQKTLKETNLAALIWGMQ